jgi:hypothetical protein
MVTDRQKRNWAKKQFERLDDDGNILETYLAPEEFETTPPPKIIMPEPVIEEEVEDFTPMPEKVSLIPVESGRYKPTRRQLQAKLRFHKYAPTSLILHLFDAEPANSFEMRGSSVSLIDYIGQIREEEFDSWLDIEGFWPWFIADDETDADLYHAKKAAADYLLEVMNLSEEDEEGKLDLGIVKMKIRVAESILKQNQTVKIEKKTVNIKNNYNGMPKQFQRMDTVRIEQRIKQLQEHSE